MPPVIDPNTNSKSFDSAIYGKVFDYPYPKKLDLDPRSDLHKELVSRIKRYAQRSKDVMSRRYDAWREQDDMLNVFIPLDEIERKIKKSDKRKPVSVVIPESYAILRTLMTYVCSGLLNDYEIFKYSPVGPEDVAGVALLEQNIALQAQRARMLLNIYTACRSGFTYGIGAVSPQWRQKRGKKRSIVSSAFEESRVTTKDGVKWEGNVLENIDPYCFLPDPSVPIQDLQEGEFVGWVVRTNRMQLLREERIGDTLFNVRYLNLLSNSTNSLFAEVFQRQTQANQAGRGSDGTSNPVDVLYMYIDLIPTEWNLGDGEYPEKWLFALAGDNLLIAAEKLDYEHDQYPVCVCAPDFDGFGCTPISRLETVHGLQVVMNWLFNSHMKNVRKNIADRFVIDPQLVDLRSVKDGEGDIILRPEAWARGQADKAVVQLKVTDITARNIPESNLVASTMQRVTGATDSLSGMQRKTSERVSAAEVHANKDSSLSQLGMDIRIISTMFMGPIGYQLASNTQQYMSEPVWMKIAGRAVEELRDEFPGKDWIEVGPDQLVAAFDCVPFDNSISMGQNPQDWLMVWQILNTSEPDVRGDYEMKNIFRYVARILGAKNISDFVKRGGAVAPQVVPNEQVQQQQQAGNYAPLPANYGMPGGLGL